MLFRQAVRQPQPQGAVVGNSGHAQLAARRLVTTAQHEEIVATGIPPVRQPFLVAAVTILRQVLLMLERIIEYIRSHDGVRFVTFEETADDFLTRHPRR